jgi:hypothetical protein
VKRAYDKTDELKKNNLASEWHVHGMTVIPQRYTLAR